MEIKDIWTVSISLLALCLSLISLVSSWWTARSSAHFAMMQKVFQIKSKTQSLDFKAVQNHYRATEIHHRLNSPESYLLLDVCVKTRNTIRRQFEAAEKIDFPRWSLFYKMRLALHSIFAEMDEMISKFQETNADINDQLVRFESQIFGGGASPDPTALPAHERPT